MEEKVLYPSKIKWILVFLGCVGFVAIAYFLMREEKPMEALFCGAIFGLGALVAFWSLMPGNSWLKLDSHGFTFKTIFKETSVAWDDVQGFAIWPFKGTKKVSYDKGSAGIAAAFSKAVSGGHGTLPDNYGMKAEKLAELMTDYLLKSRVNYMHEMVRPNSTVQSSRPDFGTRPKRMFGG